MDTKSPDDNITQYIASLTDWRGDALSHLRTLIGETAPELSEEWKWGTPIWSLNGNVLGLAAFKNHIKINFFKGASLDDPHKLFNAGLDAKTSRSIDLGPEDKFNIPALTELIRAAVAQNGSGGKKK